MNRSEPLRQSSTKLEPGFFAKVQKILTSEWGARITAYVAFFLMWQLLSIVSPRVPAPVEVFVFIWTEITGGSHGGVVRGQFGRHFAETLQRFGLGLIFAVVFGTILGIIVGSTVLARALLNDTIIVFLALPAVIWAFLTTMWFGIGPRAPIVTTFLSAFPFVTINVAQGVRAIGPDLHKMSAAFGVPKSRQLWHMIVPAVMGYIFAGIRFAIIIGWNAVLLSEWFGAAEGVGHRTRFWYDANRYQGFVGWIVIFIVFIVVLDRLVLSRLQKRAFRWRDAQAEQSETMDMSAKST